MLIDEVCHSTTVLPVHTTCCLHKFFVCLKLRIMSRDAFTTAKNTIVKHNKVSSSVCVCLHFSWHSLCFLSCFNIYLLQIMKKKSTSVCYSLKREQALLLEAPPISLALGWWAWCLWGGHYAVRLADLRWKQLLDSFKAHQNLPDPDPHHACSSHRFSILADINAQEP